MIVNGEIEGLLVGHWTDSDAATGCTVIRLPPQTVASGEVRGGFDDGSPLAGIWSTPHLMRRVSDVYESERVRLLALDAVGHTADLRGWEGVLRLTSHDRPVWRVHALHALRGYGGSQVEHALVNGLQDADPLARVFAAAGIARRGLADATDLLAEFRRHGHRFIRGTNAK